VLVDVIHIHNLLNEPNFQEEDRAFKLGFDTTPGYGRNVKLLVGGPRCRRGYRTWITPFERFPVEADSWRRNPSPRIADGCLGFGRAHQGVDRLDPVPAFEKDLSEEPVVDGADRAWVPGRKNVGQRFESRRAKPGPLIRHYDTNSRDSATRN